MLVSSVVVLYPVFSDVEVMRDEKLYSSFPLLIIPLACSSLNVDCVDLQHCLYLPKIESKIITGN